MCNDLTDFVIEKSHWHALSLKHMNIISTFNQNDVVSPVRSLKSRGFWTFPQIDLFTERKGCCEDGADFEISRFRHHAAGSDATQLRILPGFALLIFFYIHIKYYYEATFYYTLNNCAALQDDAMGAKINVDTTAIT